MNRLERLLEGRWEYGWDWKQDRAYMVIRLPRGREYGVGYFKEKLFPSPDRKALRAKVPYKLSLAVALVVEEELSGKGDLFSQVSVEEAR